jgi:hypothetical protein
MTLIKPCETGNSNPVNAVNSINPVLSSPSNVVPVCSQPQPTPPLAPNGYPGKSSISLELEVDDSSSSSDEDTNPFNPNLSASDSDDGINERDQSSAPDDRPDLFGSAPHPAPSSDGSSTPSSFSADRNVRSVTGGVAPDTSRDSSQHAIRQTAQSSPDLETSPPSRKDKKPPPPPKSHHGRRISTTATAESSQTERSRSTNRLSIHGFHDNATSGASHPSSVSLPSTADYFSAAENQRGMESTDSLQRSQSQQKRPPTPPLSRRHSQLRRSKSTQSKSSRLTMSSYDSESNDSSLPPSPGPSTRALARKRISMPPPASGDFEATAPLADVSVNLSPSTNSRPPSLKAGLRASSYGNTQAGSTGPPPLPPPRRTRDSMIRSSDSVPLSNTVENQPPSPQPSNALDILADLTKLQKEVDDLRRKVQ